MPGCVVEMLAWACGIRHLDPVVRVDYGSRMEVHLTPDQESRLLELAAIQGRGADELAQEVLGSYLEHEERFRAAVQLGLDQAGRGELISHEDVRAHFEKRYGA